jgi:cytochrome c-type biogenesis protein CcmH/NrfG
MNTLLAQTDLPSVPDTTLKWVLIILVAILLIVAVVYAAFGKRGAIKIDDQPAIEVRKAPKRFNNDLCVANHNEIQRRLDGHDAEIEQLWSTMRDEDAAIRRETGAKFDAILLALGEIKGEIKKL